MPTVIILLDHALGTLRIEEPDDRVVGIDLAEGVEAALTRLKERKARVVLMARGFSDADREVVRRAIADDVEILDPSENLSKALQHFGRVESGDEKSVFVSADRFHRQVATKLGLVSVPHPMIAVWVANKQSPQMVVLLGTREELLKLGDCVPYHLENAGEGRWRLWAAVSRESVAIALARELEFTTMSFDFSSEDLFLVHLDQADDSAARLLSQQRILQSDGSRAIVSVGATSPTEGLTLWGGHGQSQLLSPDLGLLVPAPDAGSAQRYAQWHVDGLPENIYSVVSSEHAIWPIILRPSLPTIAKFKADVDRYGGIAALDNLGNVRSRHVRHPDNARVIQALLHDLRGMGFCAYTHSFSYGGATLKNVIADLPGIGYYKMDPNLLKHLREVLVEHPTADPPDPWLAILRDKLGKAWIETAGVEGMAPQQLKAFVQDIFRLNSWIPWWRRDCILPGLGARLVIIGAHIDSSADRGANYDPATDSAPGADDNASGIATALGTARYLKAFRGKLRHTVRVCLFNAEEQGMVGSKSYVAAMKASRAPIMAAICADMVGYHTAAQRIYEIHAGYTDPAIRDLNVPIATTISNWSASLGRLAPAQIYRGTSSGAGSDRNLYDGAINRSDHAAFHQHGYPAVAVSEDFFVNAPGEPNANANPNYHRAADTVVDATYGTDIAHAIALAARELAMGL